MRKYIYRSFIAMMVVAGCSTPTAVVNFRQTDDFLKNAVERDLTAGMDHLDAGNLFYRFEHDRSNLYLTFATADPLLKRKIVQTGLTVWIDRTGGKEKNQGFRYLPGNAGSMNLQQVRDEESMNRYLSTVIERSNEIELIGIYGSSVRRVKMRDSQVRTRMQIRDELLVYQAVVPFGLLRHGYAPATGEKMSIGFETGQADRVNRRSSAEYDGPMAGRSRSPGNMGGQRPLGSPMMINERERMAAPAAELSALSRPTRLWIELTFSNGNQ